MRSRRAIALVGVVALLAIIAGLGWGPAEAQTTTSSSTTTTTIDPAVVAVKAANELSLPNPTIATNPPAAQAQFTGLPTWLWVQPWAAVRHSATTNGTTVEVVAAPTSVRFDTGDGESVTCNGAGVAYDPSRPAGAQSSDCTHTWRRSSAGAPGGVFHVTATVTWSIRWFGGLVGSRQSGLGSVDLRVAESQGLDRPPEPVPGQSVVGGAGATDGPGKGWDGKAPKPKSDKGDDCSGWSLCQLQKVPGVSWTFVKDIGTGAKDIVVGTKDTLVLLGRCGYDSINPAGLSGALTATHTPASHDPACGQLRDGLVRLVTHPGDLIRLDDILHGHPGRAVPAILLLLIPAAKAAGGLKVADGVAAGGDAAAAGGGAAAGDAGAGGGAAAGDAASGGGAAGDAAAAESGGAAAAEARELADAEALADAARAFHHTTDQAVGSIMEEGLRPGTYLTPHELSPLQAHIDLALNPAGGARNAILQVDLDGLRSAGYQIPPVTRVTGAFGMPGGGYEMQFPYEIPTQFIKVIQ